MSKTRKVLGIVLAVALILNVVAVAAFAANDDSSRTNEWTLLSDAFENEPVVGTTFTVDVQLLADYNLGPVQFALEYDNANFSVAASGAINISGYPYTANVNYNYVADKNILKVIIVPNTAGLSYLPAVKLTNATTIATITFTYLSAGTIEIADDYKTNANIGGSLCAFRSLKDDLLECGPNDLVYGQTHTITEGDHEVGSAASEPAELAIIDGTGGVIDEARGYVYGVEMTEEWQMIEDVFEATNGGYIEVDNSEFMGTGALVNLYEADGTPVATYTFILFGDIDGDGEITALDASIAEMHDFWSYGDTGRIEDEAVLFAGDIDVDGDITALDASITEMHDFWSYGENLRLTQAEVIALL